LALVAVVVVLGAVQLASSAAYGDLAARPSLPAALHALDPSLLRPFLGGPSARAAAALHNGDLAEAQRLIATLPENAESADLRGRLLEARHDSDGAIAAYVRAGDGVRAQNLIDALEATDLPRALRDQRALVAALQGERSASEETGQAWWRLGQLQAAAGYAAPARRAMWWLAAEASYERALSLAPNEETYLLAAGYQSLANGDTASAARWYAHAAAVVPNSVDAFAGEAWTAAARGDCAAARTALARARTLRGQKVRDPVDDPRVGPALRRCTT
jgi:tetratricopeptide (TPR) repeat protein